MGLGWVYAPSRAGGSAESCCPSPRSLVGGSDPPGRYQRTDEAPFGSSSVSPRLGGGNRDAAPSLGPPHPSPRLHALPRLLSICVPHAEGVRGRVDVMLSDRCPCTSVSAMRRRVSPAPEGRRARATELPCGPDEHLPRPRGAGVCGPAGQQLHFTGHRAARGRGPAPPWLTGALPPPAAAACRYLSVRRPLSLWCPLMRRLTACSSRRTSLHRGQEDAVH